MYHMITLILSFCEQERLGHGIIMGMPHPLLLKSIPHTHPTGSVLWLSYEVSFVSVPAKECSKIEKIFEGTGYPTPNLSGRSCW